MQVIVSKEFDRFIDKQTFTQKNLVLFEMELKTKLKDILIKEGIVIEGGLQASKTSRNTMLSESKDEYKPMQANLSLPAIETKFKSGVENVYASNDYLKRN
jgi:hypothetical protein